MKCKRQLTMKLEKEPAKGHPGHKSAKIKGLTRSDGPICKLDLQRKTLLMNDFELTMLSLYKPLSYNHKKLPGQRPPGQKPPWTENHPGQKSPWTELPPRTEVEELDHKE